MGCWGTGPDRLPHGQQKPSPPSTAAGKREAAMKPQGDQKAAIKFRTSKKTVKYTTATRMPLYETGSAE